jgi:Sec-independent protein translocase protein TatA
LLVGYFVLGPSDLYKLVKEIGKFIQNIRTLGSDLSTTFESNMESTLQLEELRKAQRELNDAFSFRRSINTEETAGPFSVTAGSAQIAEANRREEEMAAAVAATTGEGPAVFKERKIRRRVKRRKEEVDVVAAPPPSFEPAIATAPVNLAPVSPISSCAPDELLANNVPDLEMPHKADAVTKTTTAEELALIESEFAKYTAMPDDLVTVDVGAQSRFQQQLSGQWNDSIVQNTAKLAPMGALMEQVALLEQERKAALDRLEEEFARRKEIETQFYQKRRLAIEAKITETQETAFGVSSKPL